MYYSDTDFCLSCKEFTFVNRKGICKCCIEVKKQAPIKIESKAKVKVEYSNYDVEPEVKTNISHEKTITDKVKDYFLENKDKIVTIKELSDKLKVTNRQLNSPIARLKSLGLVYSRLILTDKNIRFSVYSTSENIVNQLFPYERKTQILNYLKFKLKTCDRVYKKELMDKFDMTEAGIRKVVKSLTEIESKKDSRKSYYQLKKSPVYTGD